MDTFLARQPIFDSDKNVSAYEILYRTGHKNSYNGLDGDEASRKVLFNTFQTFGLDNLTKNKPVFINFTESLICDETATLFPKDLLVVEILEDVLPKGDIIEKARNLKKMGYRIALDDFIYKPEYEELLDIADIVKIDFLLLESYQIKIISKYLKKRGITLLAEKVENLEDYEFARSIGYTLFQGYFFSKPEIMVSKSMEPIKSNYLQLLGEINKKYINFDKIARIISMDLSLTYNLLKLVNSSAFGFRYKIRSVKHAVVILGERQIKKWIYLVLVNTMGKDEPDELTRLSLIRARFIELIALDTKYRKDAQEFFLVGLLSLLDAILKKPKEEILDEIHASSRVREALVEEKGELGGLYKITLAYEKGQWDKFMDLAEEANIRYDVVSKAYIEAILWYNRLQQVRV